MAKFKKGHKKRGGRKKGTPNKITADVREFCEQVFRAVDPAKTAMQLMRCKSDRSKGAMLNRLLEYYYGKPIENMKLDVTTNFTEALARILARKHGQPTGSD
jgi:hypothetical protein